MQIAKKTEACFGQILGIESHTSELPGVSYPGTMNHCAVIMD